MKRTLSLTLAALTLLAACAGPRTAAPPAAADGSWITLYDGTGLDGWAQAGPGSFAVQPDGSLLGQGGMGLFYYDERPFRDFVLELDWKAVSDEANSGIFVRFPEATDDPWYAVENGYEIQVYGGEGDPINATGSVYDHSAPFRDAARPAGEWNTYRIEVRGQHYRIFLNDVLVNDWVGDRGREGYVGLQNHDDASKVWYRNVRVMPLADTDAPESLAAAVAAPEGDEPVRVLVVTATHGFRHTPAIEALRRVLESTEATTSFTFDMTEDLGGFNAANLANYDVVLLANATLRLNAEAREPQEGAWTIRIETPQGDMDGTLVLGDDAGTIAITGQTPGAIPLNNYMVSGDDVRFQFNAGEYGTATVTGSTAGGALDASLALMDMQLPITGRPAAGTGGGVLVNETQQKALLDFVRGGGGLAVTHAGLDAFYEWDAYRAMVGGGLFDSHPWTKSVRVVVEDPDNPAVTHFGDDFWIRDEIYVLDENPRWNSQVLLSLDVESAGLEGSTAGMMERGDYPISWIRREGEGRVFVTKLGHFADVWETPAYLTHVLQGLRIAAGTVEADFGGRRVKETIAEGVWPDDLAVDDRGNVWIVELDGGVHHYDVATGVARKIGAVETTDPEKIEHGLFGVEVDPDFYDGSPYVYLFYAEPETFINTLSRFTYRDGMLDMGSEEVILRVPTEPACCHQAGDLEWGPDGTLYVSTGDTGQSGTRPDQEITDEAIAAFVERNELTDYHWSRLVDSERTAQNLQSLRGKILRINKDGSIPKDNPFYGDPGVRWEIYAYGLRNPYRFKVDPATGDVLIGVVGPDAQYDYDEYNLSTEGGENFGWPRTLGRLFYNEWTPADIPDYSPPIWEYTYADGGRSATGGPIYTSEGAYRFPEVFEGKVIIADWARNWIKWADLERDAAVTTDTTSDVKSGGYRHTFTGVPRLTNVRTFDVLLEGTKPIALELSPDGSLYVAEFDGFWQSGGGAKVTRYRWVRDEPARPVGGASGASDGVGGDR